MQVAYVQLFSLGENSVTNVYQWELPTHQNIYQHKMNDLFHGCEFIRVYIDNLLVLTKVYWKYHVQKIELNLNK